MHIFGTWCSKSFTSFFVVVLGSSWTIKTKVWSSLVILCLFSEQCSVCAVIRFLYFHTIIWTDACGMFSCLKIAPKGTGFVGSTMFFWALGWFAWIFPWFQGQKALSLKVGSFTASFHFHTGIFIFTNVHKLVHTSPNRCWGRWLAN